jgi:hypothetical protein
MPGSRQAAARMDLPAFHAPAHGNRETVAGGYPLRVQEIAGQRRVPVTLPRCSGHPVICYWEVVLKSRKGALDA